MRFNPEEIVSVLRKEIEEFRTQLDVAETGTVIEVGDGIARIDGLERAMAGEMLEFESGVRGQVFNLEEGSIGAIILGEYKDVKEGQTVRRTNALLACGWLRHEPARPFRRAHAAARSAQGGAMSGGIAFWQRALRHPSFVVGGMLSAALALAALVSLFWSPYPPAEIDIPKKLQAPSAAHWLN